MKRRGWTLLELMVAGVLLLLLVGVSSMGLLSFSQTLRGLEREGDQVARAAHALENLQHLTLCSNPLAPGIYQLSERPLPFEKTVELRQGWVWWADHAQGPARDVTVTVTRAKGHLLVRIVWEMPKPLATLTSAFDATLLR